MNDHETIDVAADGAAGVAADGAADGAERPAEDGARLPPGGISGDLPGLEPDDDVTAPGRPDPVLDTAPDPVLDPAARLEARRIASEHAHLLRAERSCVADLLRSIADFEARGLHLALGHASTFDYLHRTLGMSRGMAHYRLVAARLVRRFPEVEEALRDGRLCVTVVIELARVLKAENRSEVLPRFFGLSRDEAKQVVAEIDPALAVPRRTVVTEVLGRGVRLAETRGVAPGEAPPGAGPSTVTDVSDAGLTDVPGSGVTHVSGLEPVEPGTGAPGSPAGSTIEPGAPGGAGSSTIEPARTGRGDSTVDHLTATASRLHITVSREFLTLLRMAKAGESHRNPGATDEEVLKAALQALLEKQLKRKASVPGKVKREVMRRDERRCQWVLEDGTVCGSTTLLEVDHVHPRAQGGPSTVENCRILCRAHNLQAARQAYGGAFMDRFAPRRGG